VNKENPWKINRYWEQDVLWVLIATGQYKATIIKDEIAFLEQENQFLRHINHVDNALRKPYFKQIVERIVEQTNKSFSSVIESIKIEKVDTALFYDYKIYSNKRIIQIGAHVGNTENDPIFKDIDESTKIILVEPVPYLFEQLKSNYKTKLKNLENIIFINKAVSDSVGEIELTIPSERNDFSNLPFWASQLTSINSNHAKDHVCYDTRINNLIVEKIKVKTTTIDDMIKEYNINEIDLLHTDTESHDYVILMNYSFAVKPRQVLFEHKHIDGPFITGEKYKELSNRLIEMGYTKKYQDTEDTMFELC
jgi:FkbM family methyltransferase